MLFSVLWYYTDLENMVTKYRMHHPKASVERISLPNDLVGKGRYRIRALIIFCSLSELDYVGVPYYKYQPKVY